MFCQKEKLIKNLIIEIPKYIQQRFEIFIFPFNSIQSVLLVRRYGKIKGRLKVIVLFYMFFFRRQISKNINKLLLLLLLKIAF